MLISKALIVKHGPIQGAERQAAPTRLLPSRHGWLPTTAGWRVYILKYLNAAENKNYLHSPTELAGHFNVCSDGVLPSRLSLADKGP